MDIKERIAQMMFQYRKQKQWTQKELATGICTQTVISKIEKGESLPSVDLFFKLAKKLEMPMEDILALFNLEAQVTNQLSQDQIQTLLYRQDYQTLAFLLDKMNLETASYDDVLTYKWVHAILAFHLEKDAPRALEEFDELIAKEKQSQRIYYLALNSKAIVQMEIKDYQAAKVTLEGLEQHYYEFLGPEFVAKVLINLARLYLYLDNNVMCLDYATKTVDLLVKGQKLFLLGEAYFYQAYAWNELGLLDSALLSCQRSVMLFEIEEKKLAFNAAKSLLREIEEGIKTY
ncbi:helix-turn-helix transcriptional regulator [uncultured Abiotrophia sp.]|mgnify:FL=1|uniref:helix-turn-helix transcriptional regulator n=1 Tax=uncultured Abiotrophia sp. TaxID=316094 RepID=UPI0028DC6320|nr:helix-turn-helix transcriptional regulator [uncultured Abiotrophia sp.]